MNALKATSKTPLLLGETFFEVRTMLLPVSKELADSDTVQILEHVLGFSRSELYINFRLAIRKDDYNKIISLAHQRLTGRPLPYILGYAYFYSKKFSVSPEVIIPRPDTETLIETVLKNEPREKRLFFDLGTGSGILAETLVCENPQWQAIAADISFPAVTVAKTNCSAGILLVCMDRLSAVKMLPCFDFIVSNPPYISRKELAGLDRSVIDFEPPAGLCGGDDGLDFYRYCAHRGAHFLKRHGALYCEIGSTQADGVKTIFEECGWQNISLHHDCAGRPRVIRAQKK